MITKRIFDFLGSFAGLLLLSPVLLLISLVILVDSPGPVFFRQQRVGRYGNLFRIHKFRTMRVDAERAGMQITVGDDPRITRSGRWLRRYKLDELPQLIDVLVGDMSLVGPRPEVPGYVDMYPSASRELVLSVRPGITDPASIQFRAESEILSKAKDPEREYVESILPVKIELYEQYVRTRTFLGDIFIIFKTFKVIAS